VSRGEKSENTFVIGELTLLRSKAASEGRHEFHEVARNWGLASKTLRNRKDMGLLFGLAEGDRQKDGGKNI
jgi:hypothetical protein